VRDEVTATDKEAVDKRAAEEAAEGAVVKAAAAEATGVAGGSLAPDQAPSATVAKRSVAPSGSTPPAKHPYRGVWKPQFV
jgi:hypothetical protein